MKDYLYVILGLSIIFLATSLGASFAFLFKRGISNRLNQIFLGFSAGIMLSASIFSLIMPALETENNNIPIWLIVSLSILAGGLFIWGIDKLLPHLHKSGEEGIKNNKISKNTKMFLAVTIHNIPEGLSVGIAFGVVLANNNSFEALLGALFLAIGIGIQNIPEGAVVSLMFKGEGVGNKKSFLYGMLSGIVEPIAGVIGLLLAFSIKTIMPYALSFSAGCMLYVIAEEMIPDMKGDSLNHYGVWSFFLGFIIMMILDVSLG